MIPLGLVNYALSKLLALQLVLVLPVRFWKNCYLFVSIIFVVYI